MSSNITNLFLQVYGIKTIEHVCCHTKMNMNGKRQVFLKKVKLEILNYIIIKQIKCDWKKADFFKKWLRSTKLSNQRLHIL